MVKLASDSAISRRRSPYRLKNHGYNPAPHRVPGFFISKAFLAALFAHLFAFLRGFVFHALFLCFDQQIRYLDGIALPVDGDHVDISPVDHFPFAVQGFPVGIHPDLHGRTAHTGNPALQHHHIAGVGRSLELQIVDRCGGNDGTAMADGNDARQLVDPFQKVTAKESAVMIDVSRADQILLLRQGIGNFFNWSHGCSFLFGETAVRHWFFMG